MSVIGRTGVNTHAIRELCKQTHGYPPILNGLPIGHVEICNHQVLYHVNNVAGLVLG